MDDEAMAVRVLWPTLRDNLPCTPLAPRWPNWPRNAMVLAAVARKVLRLADETPTV
jgi:hypothetical protein